MATTNVFWKTAIDFRDFDISGTFSYQDDINRTIAVLDGPAPTYEDQITIKAGLGSGNNPSFLGGGVATVGQTITGGSLGLYVDNRPGGFDGYIQPLGGRDMASLNSVIDTAGLKDDRAFLREMLAGDDTMVLSGGAAGVASADYAFGAAGDDTMSGWGGNDTLLGEVGDDAIFGGAGRDSLVGGAGLDGIDGGSGDDRIFGGAQSDLLGGGGGRDLIDGGRGNDGLAGGNRADTLVGGGGMDSMLGGGGSDTFLFRAGAGDDVIGDWQEGLDRIRIETKVNLGIAIDYSGADAAVTFTKGVGFLEMRIVIEDVANNSLQLSQQGNVFFLT